MDTKEAQSDNNTFDSCHQHRPKDLKWYEKITYGIITTMEHFFYLMGKKIAQYPIRTIIICWTFVLLSALGLLNYYQEKDPFALWVHAKTQFRKDSDWLMKTLETGFRTEQMIIVADDVLTPEVMWKLQEIDERVRNSITAAGVAYEDVCFRIPGMDPSFFSLLTMSSKKSNSSASTALEFDLGGLNEQTYCTIIEAMDQVCYTKSILDLWQHNERKIRQTTKQDILNKINSMKQDPIYGNLKNYEALLGDIKYNSTGHIIGAGALTISWMTLLNFTAVNMNEVGNFAGTSEWASADCLDWENEFLHIMESEAANARHHHTNLSIYYSSSRSFGEISGSAMFQGFEVLFIGGVIMLFYVVFVISKFNWVELRAILGAMGLLSVGMALISACGIGSMFGIPFGPIHSSLPFLLMGLGVDDMFVIVACWDLLTPEEKKLSLVERIGLMMKHAGVSITVTTATDVLAFIVGSTTVLPSLASYCIYTAIGIALTFMFVVTFFVGCFTLDQQRLEKNYNGLLPWIHHKNHKPNRFSQAQTSSRVFHWVYSKVILTWPGKLFVVLISLISLGISAPAVFKLEQRFDLNWFIPDNTYLGAFNVEKTKFYPSMGFEAGTFIGAVNYTQEYRGLWEMSQDLENQTNYIVNVVAWMQPFREYVKAQEEHLDLLQDDVGDEQFNRYLSKFLFSPQGAKYQANFKFEKNLKCGQPASHIMLSSIDYTFKQFSGRHEHIPAMKAVNRISKSMNLSTGDQFSTAWSRVFATWISDDIIEMELVHNIVLALIAVMIVTSLLIANIQICFWVFVMIILSMINVTGFMQKWGITIDTISCVALQLAIGLCVDYATHIGHKFLTVAEGTRNERALTTVTTIGSAVLYGGCSTLIGVTMLSFSDSYSFRMFFKIFLLVIIFGLYHGIVLFPVILSWCGPKPYRSHEHANKHKPVAQSDNSNS